MQRCFFGESSTIALKLGANSSSVSDEVQMNGSSSQCRSHAWSFAVDIGMKQAMQNQPVLHHHLMSCTTCLGATESGIDITLCRRCCLAIIPELTRQLHFTVLEHSWLPASLVYIKVFFPDNRVTVRVNEGGVQFMTAKGYFQLSESLRESSLTRWIPRVERMPGGLF